MRKVLLVLVVVLVGFVAFVATRPAEFKIERAATIAAPEAVIYANIDDFREWGEWSPWEKLDPDLVRNYEGAESGVGAAYHWTGNDQVGEGRMTITEADPAQRIVIQLDFLKPWQASNVTTFALAPVDEGTHVTWTMEGNNDFMAKAMGVFMNMDQMVGGDFEKGLAALKEVAEAETAAMPADSAVADSVAADTTAT
jgi:uncharacterized protein YndB with AHSA1/START domain